MITYSNLVREGGQKVAPPPIKMAYLVHNDCNHGKR